MKKILNYNPKILLENLELLPEDYLAANWNSVYKQYQDNFTLSKFLYDRSGNIQHFLNIDELAYPIPKIPKDFNLSFNDIVEKRAKEILSIGKPINVSWSGGIDSTFVLFTLYHYAQDKSQIKVYGTYDSVIESGYLFDTHIKDRFQYDIHPSKSYKTDYNKPGEIFVTGSMGNNLFYQGFDWSALDSWIQFKDPRGSIEQYADSPYEKVLIEEPCLFLEKCIKNSQRKIETIQDLRWLIQFNFNWYTTKTNSYIEKTPESCKDIHGFFATNDFQIWSMVNNDIPSKIGDYSDERWQLRDMISEYTGDELYSKLKRNHTSITSTFNPNWMFLLSDYSNIYVNDLQSPTSVSYK